jgi:hypothetical protein
MNNNCAGSISINNRKRALEITKDFQKKANIYGSEEYNALKEAKADFPTYRVIVKTHKKTLEDTITMKDIVFYVEKTSGKESEEMKSLIELRGTSAQDIKDIFEVEDAAKFGTIKKWFFTTYPEIGKKTENRQKRINQIIEEAEAKAKAKAEAEAADEAASA